MNKNFGIDQLKQISEWQKRLPRMLVAIVAQPRFYSQLVKMEEFKVTKIPARGGVTLYIDHTQESSCIGFYDRDLLRRYLNRNEPGFDNPATEQQAVEAFIKECQQP